MRRTRRGAGGEREDGRTYHREWEDQSFFLGCQQGQCSGCIGNNLFLSLAWGVMRKREGEGVRGTERRLEEGRRGGGREKEDRDSPSEGGGRKEKERVQEEGEKKGIAYKRRERLKYSEPVRYSKVPG
jgi:hypothetical protein